jgi:hypothetical protein
MGRLTADVSTILESRGRGGNNVKVTTRSVLPTFRRKATFDKKPTASHPGTA